MNATRSNAFAKGTAQWARCAFALDVQGGRVVVCRGERHGRGVRVSAADVAQAVAQSGTGRAAVIAALPARISFTRWLEAPFASSAKALKVAPTLLDIQLPFPLEQCLHSFVASMPTDDGKTRCLAAAARRTDVEAELRTLQELQLDPVALDHTGLTLWTQALREFPAAGATDVGVRAVVCLNGDRSCVVFGRGTDFVSSHAFREENPDQVARLLHAQLPELGADEAKIEWIWCGAGTADPARLSRARNSLLDRYPGSCGVAEEPETFLMRGLLTRALFGGSLRCNLRTGQLTHSEVVRRSTRGSLAAALVLLLTAAALFAGNVAARMHLASREGAIDREFASVRDALLGYRHNVKGERAVEAVRLKLEKDRKELWPFLEVFRPGVAATLGEIMAKGKEQGMTYSVVTLSADKVTIRGTAPDYDRPQALRDLLKARGYAVRVERKTVTEDGRVPFTVVEEGTP